MSYVAKFRAIYPDDRLWLGDRIVDSAKDYLATEYVRANPGASPEAIEENARVWSVAEAMGILEDAGEITFARGERDRAQNLDG